MRDTIRVFAREAEANWIAQHQPELWARTDKYLLLSGYLNYRVTGRYVDSAASQVGYIPFDYRRDRWAAAWGWKWQCLPIKPGMLPQLVPAATINTTTTPRYLEATRFIPPYRATVPAHYNAEVQITHGFWMVNWFKEQFGLHEEIEAKKRDVAPESLFDDLVNAVPPGAQGLMLQPFWNPGVKVPGPEAKGAVIGFGDVHTRAHLYRAILEGLAYALRDGKKRIERCSGRRIERVRVSGGGSQSDATLQITANIFNLPTERPHLYETSGLGAAVGLGLHPDFATAVRETTPFGRIFQPEPRHARTYDQLHRKVYCRMYQRLQPLYRKIREITGYPGPER